MITKHTKRPDWFRIDHETARPLFGLPGLLVEDPAGTRIDRYAIHRNMLPLLSDVPSQAQLLALNISGDAGRWAARDAHTAELGFKLRVTQHQAIDFITRRRGTLLGDDMRLGKTLSAIMSHDPATGPLVIVAPLSTRAVWLGWLRRVWPNTPIGLTVGKKYDAAVFERQIIVGHYDVITHWQKDITIGTLVFDEAHALTNRTTRRAEAAAFLQLRASRVIAMTGTPIWNMPPDLWQVLSLIAPSSVGSYYDFANRYGAPLATGHGNKYTGISNEVELRERMTEIMLRRRWIDCAEDLPPITRSIVVAEVTQAQQNKLDILAAKLKSERSNTIGNLSAYRRQVTSVKVGVTVREAQKVVSRGEPVVVWTWHRDYADIIARELERSSDYIGTRAPVFVIHGEIAPAKRDELIEQWRTTPNGVLVSTMSVAQVGIDLSHARIAIFAEIDYTPAILGQAEMRTFMPTRSMDIIFVIANHLVDQRIVRALVSKLSAASSIGVGAACDAIDAMREAVMGPEDHGDLDRMLEDLIASAT